MGWRFPLLRGGTSKPTAGMPFSNITYDKNYYVDEPVGLGHAAGYTAYSRAMWGDSFTWDGFAQTTQARALAKGFDITGRKVLIVGCAFGYMIEYLLALGVDPYGIDVSSYAIGQADPSIASRVYTGDATQDAVVKAAKQAFGMKRNDRFDLIVSEDLLVCLTDAEAQAADQAWRANAQQVGHRVTTHPIVGGWYNIHMLAEWRALLGPQSWLWDYFDWTEG